MKYYSYFILKIFLFLLLIITIIFFYSFTKNKKEGFDSNYTPWPNQLVQRFIEYQRTVNLNYHQFDLDILQKQATPDEAEHLLQTGFWPWPDDLQYEYLDKVYHTIHK